MCLPTILDAIIHKANDGQRRSTTPPITNEEKP